MIWNLHIICIPPDDMSFAAFDKHLRPVGSHIGHEKNSFAAYRLTFWPLFSTVRDGGRLLHNSGRQIPFGFFLVVVGLHIYSVSTGHRNGSTWMQLSIAFCKALQAFTAHRVLGSCASSSGETATTLIMALFFCVSTSGQEFSPQVANRIRCGELLLMSPKAESGKNWP